MKKRVVGIIAAITMLMSIMPQIIVNAAEDITISNLSELEEFRDDVNSGNTYEGKTVTLTANIDMSEKYGEGKSSWTSIGYKEPYPSEVRRPFAGTFDGKGHKIINLYMDREGCGLFGVCTGTIKDLNVEGVIIHKYIDDVEYTEYTGGIVGFLNEGTVERCSFSGSIEGLNHVGGIDGVGFGDITDCFNTGTIKAEHCGCGILGTGELSNITRCYNIGNIEIAETEYTSEFFASIACCVTVTDCYYLEGTSENGAYESNGTTTALTLAQLADKNNFVNWDFDTIWEMSAELGRPVLRSGNAKKHIHKICGDENCTDNHEDIEWIAWDSTDTLPTEAGNYYLTSDVEISSTWTPIGDTKLCLNGHTIMQTKKEMPVLTLSDTVFTLCDCQGTGKLTGGRCGVFSGYQSTFNMYGGIITGNKWNGSVVDGGGVVVYPYNTFNMFGGEISGNSDAMTGGVHVSSNGSMNIGGKVIIKDNTNTEGNIANILSSGGGSQINIVKPLKEGAYIGIAYHSAFTKIPFGITTGNDTDYSGYFHSDNNRYAIENSENNIVRLVYKNSDYPYYEITDLMALDLENKKLSAISANKDFKVYYTLQQIASLGETDFGYAVAAIYDTEGALIGVRSEKITRYHSAPTGFYFDVSSEDKTVGSIKAFVWDGFNSMKPLAENEKISFVE